jgi:DNA-binding MarR family transcriptional regulator
MMSDAVEIYGEFGQTLAYAEAILNRVLERHLSAHGTTPNRWYALKLTAQAEPIARAAVVDGLVAGGKVQPVDAEPLLRALEADGLIEGDDVVSLTESGRGYFAQLREYVITPTIRLLGQFELADVETTIRTLREITTRAREEELQESPAI